MGAIRLSIVEVETVLRNQKFLFIPAIPLAALAPWLLLRKLNFNFLEHWIVVCFLLSMNTFLGIALGVLGLAPLSFETYAMIYFPLSFVVLFYDFLLFWQLTKDAGYSTWSRLWRTVISGFVSIMIVVFAQQFAMGILAGKRANAQENVPPPTEIPATSPTEDATTPGN